MVDPEVAEVLRRAELAEGEDDALWGRVRARRLGGRVYFLERHEGTQYRQDVWPETDVLLEEVDAAEPGRCLDVGTGCGILAIEAAARGHAVVATDLYESAVELARFNAQINQIDGIDFRAGHLFEPVAEETFDLIVTAPHYGRVFDQLRLEVLSQGPKHLAPGGRLFLATTLEWEQGAPLGVEPILRRLGARATPIVAQKSWFTFDAGEVPRLTSRHRFLVEVGGRFGVEMPPQASQPTRNFVPLARLRAGGAAAVVDGEDVDALRRILSELALPHARFEQLPAALLDACRFGARPCAKAAGALVDTDGQVRPCTHGAAVATAGDTLAALTARLTVLHEEAQRRRGCAACEAKPVCSQCLFPAALDEAAYCELVRAHQRVLPLFHRLLETARLLDGLASPILIDRWPQPSVAPSWPELARRFEARSVWLVRDGARASLWWPDGDRLHHQILDGPSAAVAAQVGKESSGDPAPLPLPARRVEAVVTRLAQLVDPSGIMGRTTE
jgi:radical SAM protein with 4Fe4S-binding SPASM domain